MMSKAGFPLGANATIGIIGGGQLGRMMASAAARLGFKTIVLEPGAEAPASQLCNEHIMAAYDDPAALARLSDACDIVTYEFENVPREAVLVLEGKCPLAPPAMALEISQDRLTEKNFLQKSGINVAPFVNVESLEDLQEGLSQFGGGVLKTRRFGYDGKGQHVFVDDDPENAAGVFAELGAGPFVLEQKIDFRSEVSVIAARGWDGSIFCYDPATNSHENGILRRSTVPATLSSDLIDRAKQMTSALLDALEYVGVIGVEFFETDTGLLVNEFAPRVHNSGHWTYEACSVSQFEMHIRAICGLPLVSSRYHDCEMVNLLGSEIDVLDAYWEDASATVTLYGKTDAKPGRKMGHVTFLKGQAN